MTSSFIHNHPQEEGASLNTRICVTERLGKQDRLAPRRKGARSSKSLLASVMSAHPSFGRPGHHHSPPDTTLSTPSASPPMPLDLRAGRVPNGALNPFFPGLPFLLPGAGQLSAQEAFLSRFMGQLPSGGLAGVHGSSHSHHHSHGQSQQINPSELLAAAQSMRTGSPLHGPPALLPPFTSESLLGQRLSSFRPFIGSHSQLASCDDAPGTSRAYSPPSLPPHLRSHFSNIVQNGLTPPGSVSNASTSGGLLEPECVLQTSETKRVVISPSGSSNSVSSPNGASCASLSPSDHHIHSKIRTSSIRLENDLDVDHDQEQNDDVDAIDQEDGIPLMVHDLSTKGVPSRRTSSVGSPFNENDQLLTAVNSPEVRAMSRSPSLSSPPTNGNSEDIINTNSPNPAVSAYGSPTENGHGDSNDAVSIIVRKGDSDYLLHWNQLESLFKVCSKCGTRSDDETHDDVSQSECNKTEQRSESSRRSLKRVITVDTLCDLGRPLKKRKSSEPMLTSVKSER